MNDHQHSEGFAEKMDDYLQQIHDLVQKLTVLDATEHGVEPGVLTCVAFFFETWRYNDDGRQMYHLDHLTTKEGSLAQTLGLVSYADKVMNDRLFGCRHGEDR